MTVGHQQGHQGPLETVGARPYIVALAQSALERLIGNIGGVVVSELTSVPLHEALTCWIPNVAVLLVLALTLGTPTTRELDMGFIRIA